MISDSALGRSGVANNPRELVNPTPHISMSRFRVQRRALIFPPVPDEPVSR